MAFKRPLPEWNNPGVEPPQSKKDMGWLGREKPPAQWHNWFQHLVFKALEELQQNAAHVTFGVTAPTSPDVNDLWVDTSGFPVLILKAWDGTQWVTVGAVSSVNGKTGDIELTAEDVGAASLTAFNEHLNDKLQDGVHGLATTQNMTLYVDPMNGDDSNDGLTVSTALATVQKAIDKIPKYLLHDVNINLLPGIYRQSFIVSGFIGIGRIGVIGLGDTENVKFIKNYQTNNAIRVYRCNSPIELRNIYIENEESSNAKGIDVLECQIVVIDNCVIKNFGLDAYNGGVYVSRSKVTVRYSKIYNCFSAITSGNLGMVYSHTNNGDGNNVGLFAQECGILAKRDTQPKGNTMESIRWGGLII